MEDVCGYVLAGGRSSRMGVDKAEMRLGGRTLLEVAVGKLRGVCAEVAVVGERASVPRDVRMVADVHPGCGPLGGIEAGLRDAGGGPAMFFPVDMPFFPSELLRRLAAAWILGGERACFAVLDGRAQPLLNLLRREILPEVSAALDRGEYKVRPVLERSGDEGVRGEGDADLRTPVLKTEIWTTDRRSVWPGWEPEDADWENRELWFANLNTPEEFRAAAERAHCGS